MNVVGRTTITHRSMESPAQRRRAGITLLEARLDGDFPGSPVTLQFRFALEGDRIAGLEIGK